MELLRQVPRLDILNTNEHKGTSNDSKIPIFIKLVSVVKDKFKNKYIVSKNVSIIYVAFRPNDGLYRMAKNPIGVPIKFNDISSDANKT